MILLSAFTILISPVTEGRYGVVVLVGVDTSEEWWWVSCFAGFLLMVTKILMIATAVLFSSDLMRPQLAWRRFQSFGWIHGEFRHKSSSRAE
jgi:hypothetical protein